MVSPMYRVLKKASLACGMVFTLLASASHAQKQEDVNPVNVVMERFHNEMYQAGQTFEVQVRISADSNEMTAMGLRESIPLGWIFMGMQGVTGDVPAVAPSGGESGLLEFAWISVPQMPYTFSYTLQVPENDPGGSQVFHGALEYRLSGGAQFAAPVITSVNGAADTQPPVITLVGGNSITVQVNGAWSEPGYTARDNVDGDVTGSVTVAGNVDTSVAGNYELTYSVSDRAGNRGTARRIVTVSGSATDGGTGGGGVGGGGVTNPRPGTGVGNGTGTSRPVSGAPMDTRRVADQKAAKAAAAAKQAAQAKAVEAKAAEAAKAGSLQMRPGVHGGQDPAAGVVIPGADGAQPVDPNAPPARANDGGEATAPDATQSRDGDDADKKLSDAWPTLEGTDPAAVTKADAASGASQDGAVKFGPKSSSSSLLVVAAVAGVIFIGIAGSMFAARTVYGGRRRRAAPPRES